MTTQMPVLSLQQTDVLEAQEHQDQQDQLAQSKAEVYKQVQRAKDFLPEPIDRENDDTLIENLTNIYNTSTAGLNKSNSDRKLIKSIMI